MSLGLDGISKNYREGQREYEQYRIDTYYYIPYAIDKLRHQYVLIASTIISTGSILKKRNIQCRS